MHDPVPSCFRGAISFSPPPPSSTSPTLTTSVYETDNGLAAFTWSRTVLGLSLRVELRLPASSTFCSASSSVSGSSSDTVFDSFSLRFRPWIVWKRKGVKRFHLKTLDQQSKKVDLAWDLTRARLAASGGPEPTSGFFVAVAVDGEMFLLVGDSSSEEAYRKTKTRRRPSFSKRGTPGNPILVSRSEHVLLPGNSGTGGGLPYTTSTKMGGKEREISIDLGGGREKDAKLCVGLDGKRVLHVKRLRWKFRGNEKVEVEDHPSSSGMIQISWDVHNWLFNSVAAPTTELAHAMVVFRFDKSEEEEEERIGNKSGQWGMHELGYFGANDGIGSVSGSNFSVVGGGWRRKRNLLKTSSSSSSASSSSSVLSWASQEENELKESDGFFLVVYVWKR